MNGNKKQNGSGRGNQKKAKSSQAGTKRAKGGNPSNVGLVQAPAAMGTVQRRRIPREQLSPGGRILTFREYVQDIPGSVAFQAASYPIQPGVPTLFAWLATQAISYQQYRFRKLKFEFMSEKASSLSGKLMMAFLPDAADPVPTSKQDMLENEWKLACNIWLPRESMSVPCTEALGAWRYIRSGTLAANLDIKTYDFGQLIVATQGCPDATDIGELYVEYEIELKTPVINSIAFGDAFYRRGTAIAPAVATPFGTSISGSGGGLNVNLVGDTITFNRVGRYLCVFRHTGTGIDTLLDPVISGSSTAFVSLAPLGAGCGNAAADVGTVGWYAFVATVSARGQTVVVDLTGEATTITATAFSICMGGA